MKSGRTAHLSGLAAEDIAARLYLGEGGEIRARRWRCPEGELDLVVALGGSLVFVEVKARRSHAPDAVTPRQWRRIAAAASRYLAEETEGTTPCRFDLVLVDRAGRTERIENALVLNEW